VSNRYESYSYIDVSISEDGIALLTLNRPEKLNACTADGHDEMGRIWADLDSDPSVRVSVVTGAGKAFCAGGDLGESDLTDSAGVTRTINSDAAIVRGMVRSTKPIISAINGVAVGAGLAVALLADISVAGRSAKLIDGHTKLGVVAGDHAALVWPLACGLPRAKRYLLTCDTITGEEAERIGLVSECVADEELMPTAMALALRLSTGSQWAIQGTKRVLNTWLEKDLSVFEHSLSLEFTSFFLPDAAEGVGAFKEKRAPEFPSAKNRLTPEPA
jgi:enoyl-CoA hydratase